jgi:RNA polymerase sigma-70 factor (ECF subfamily)
MKIRDYTQDELFKIIDALPEGYKMVFNLYAIEGYKHKEIADMLNINQNTSKSQYSRAKEKIRQQLEQISKIKKKNVEQQ